MQDGFEKVFNLWDDMNFASKISVMGNPIPARVPGQVDRRCEDTFGKGEIMMHGVDATKTPSARLVSH